MDLSFQKCDTLFLQDDSGTNATPSHHHVSSRTWTDDGFRISGDNREVRSKRHFKCSRVTSYNVRDLDKLNLVEPGYGDSTLSLSPSFLKNDAHFKSGQKWLKKIISLENDLAFPYVIFEGNDLTFSYFAVGCKSLQHSEILRHSFDPENVAKTKGGKEKSEKEYSESRSHFFCKMM